MNYVLDTHALIWFLAGDARLGKNAKKILTANDADFFIPAIVMAEIAYLQQRRRLAVSLADVKEVLTGSPNVTLYPIDMRVIDEIPAGFEIHDALIIATVKVLERMLTGHVGLITRDEEITSSGIVKTYW